MRVCRGDMGVCTDMSGLHLGGAGGVLAPPW